MIDARALLVALLDAAEADPALGERMRRLLGAPAADDLLDVAELARLAGVRERVVLDDHRRGRIELVGRRGHWKAHRAEAMRWMTQRRPVPSNDTTCTDAREEARRDVEAAAARAARGTR